MRCRAFLAISRATGVKKETPSNSPFIYIYIFLLIVTLLIEEAGLQQQLSLPRIFVSGNRNHTETPPILCFPILPPPPPL